ncbi:hypothetical protein CEXT_502201 [Caerostris extrusa]|uniref:Uncharacterized protein n=1 Tax=Caerostris extrusa TaxID=172846 RepID=A0AAV4U8M6_CAEEX|nr:hypothetical protein CEXT_502201 [Caerostris extrusa]
MSILSLVEFLSSVHAYLVTVAVLFRVSTTGAGALKQERSEETTSKELSTVLLVSWCLLPMTVVLFTSPLADIISPRSLFALRFELQESGGVFPRGMSLCLLLGGQISQLLWEVSFFFFCCVVWKGLFNLMGPKMMVEKINGFSFSL